MGPNTQPIPDPPNALPLEFAKMVASGMMEPSVAILQAADASENNEYDEEEDLEAMMQRRLEQELLAVERAHADCDSSATDSEDESDNESDDEIGSITSDYEDSDDDSVVEEELEELLQAVKMRQELV